RQARVPALHAPGGVPRLARPRGAALRRPRQDRALAQGARALMSSFLDNGTVLGGYRLESVLGSGGTGVVYLATKLDLSRAEALKVLAPELRDDLQFRQRLRREGGP